MSKKVIAILIVLILIFIIIVGGILVFMNIATNTGNDSLIKKSEEISREQNLTNISNNNATSNESNYNATNSKNVSEDFNNLTKNTTNETTTGMKNLYDKIEIYDDQMITGDKVKELFQIIKSDVMEYQVISNTELELIIEEGKGDSSILETIENVIHDDTKYKIQIIKEENTSAVQKIKILIKE